MITMANCNKTKAEQTADPSKYPQGYFKTAWTLLNKPLII